MRPIALSLVLVLAGAAWAQSLEVTLAWFSPPERRWSPGERADFPIAVFSFAATSGPVQLDGIILTTFGTGNFGTHLAAGTGLQAWLDVGSHSFKTNQDVLLAVTSGASPTAALWFGAPVMIPNGARANIWIVGSFLHNHRRDRSFGVSVANVGDVAAGSATVTLGTPSPDSALVHTGKFISARVGGCAGDCCTAQKSRSSAILLVAASVIALRLRRRGARRTIGTYQVVPGPKG